MGLSMRPESTRKLERLAGRQGVAKLATKPEKSLAERLCRREVRKKAHAPLHFNVYVILRVMKDQGRML